jgi:cytochrome P450
MSSNTAAPPCPAHVPAELVREFNLNDTPGISDDPYAVMSKVGHDAPRIFWSTTHHAGKQPGSWWLTRSADIRYVLQKPLLFSSKETAAFSLLLGESWDLVPLEQDAPRHTAVRNWLNPIFSHLRIRPMESGIRQTCVRLVETFANDGGCEFVGAFGRPFPITVVLQLLGLPYEHVDMFLKWEDQLLHSHDFGVMAEAARKIKDYLLAAIELRRKTPTDDLFSQAIRAEIKGVPLSADEILGFCYLLFVGGLDTVASSLAFHFKHLAEHPDLQKQLRANPEIIPKAVEELLRRYAIVTTHRRATQDTELAGIQIKSGDWITICTPMSAMDEHEYKDPEIVDFTRTVRSHVTFAFGPHICLGMHLARREMAIALEEWIARVPVFRLKPGSRPKLHAGGVFGVDELQLVWD